MVNCLRLDGTEKNFRIQKLFKFTALSKEETNEVTQHHFGYNHNYYDLYL